MIKIIESDDKHKERLEKIITKDGTYIDVSLITSPMDRYTDRLGLDYAISELKKDSEQTIVLHSFERASSLYMDQRFMSIMARAKSYFIRDSFLKADLDMELDTPKFDSPALGIQAKIAYVTDRKSRLLHDYKSRPAEVIETIKKEFDMHGTDSEILEQLRTHDLRFSEIKGVLPGVYVDIDGTLLRGDKLSSLIVSTMIEYSKTRPVCLWTGGGKEIATKKIGRLFEETCKKLGSTMHTRVPILDKQLFAGYRPQIVIDDLPKEMFERDYKIFPEMYFQVT
jgi:hypothetical protein